MLDDSLMDVRAVFSCVASVFTVSVNVVPAVAFNDVAVVSTKGNDVAAEVTKLVARIEKGIVAAEVTLAVFVVLAVEVIVVRPFLEVVVEETVAVVVTATEVVDSIAVIGVEIAAVASDLVAVGVAVEAIVASDEAVVMLSIGVDALVVVVVMGMFVVIDPGETSIVVEGIVAGVRIVSIVGAVAVFISVAVIVSAVVELTVVAVVLLVAVGNVGSPIVVRVGAVVESLAGDDIVVIVFV
ncbi:unnamed protein product [Haemonchus placei]|uniref:Uncharacterized protein n=1 Tax=Haemonchus placei TaxID=6290 RepID=A0A0N4X613_HAEPC|nr:unnamed protein product [Haemonchus placei]